MHATAGRQLGVVEAVCGACTVTVDGRLTSSCLEYAARCDGRDIETIEGLGEPGRLHPIQQAFIDHGGFQCGICTPGMILTARALLARHPSPTDEQIERWMMGSLCRCTGYYKIRISIHAAAKALAAARDRPRRDSDAARGETV